MSYLSLAGSDLTERTIHPGLSCKSFPFEYLCLINFRPCFGHILCFISWRTLSDEILASWPQNTSEQNCPIRSSDNCLAFPVSHKPDRCNFFGYFPILDCVFQTYSKQCKRIGMVAFINVQWFICLSKENRDSICCCHMYYCVIKIYQHVVLQLLSLQLH